MSSSPEPLVGTIARWQSPVSRFSRRAARAPSRRRAFTAAGAGSRRLRLRAAIFPTALSFALLQVRARIAAFQAPVSLGARSLSIARAGALALPSAGLAALGPRVSLAAWLERAASMRRADAFATLAVAWRLRFEWAWPAAALRGLAPGAHALSLVVAGAALDRDGPPLAVVRRAALDAPARPLGVGSVGGDFGAQSRDMLAPALGRRPLQRRAPRRVALQPALRAERAATGSSLRRPLRAALASRALASLRLGRRRVADDQG